MPAWYSFNHDSFFSLKQQGEGKWIHSPVISICVRTCYYCNFSCKHCLSKSGITKSRHVDWIYKSLYNLKTLFGPLRLVWSGGEPSLIRELTDLLLLSESFGNINIITTNGTNYVSSPGCHWINYSIYGCTETEYYKNTGSYGEKTIWRNIARSISDGIPTSINLIIGLMSNGSIATIIEKCLMHGVNRIKFHRPLFLSAESTHHKTTLQSEIDYLKKLMHSTNIIATFPNQPDTPKKDIAYWVLEPTGVMSSKNSKIHTSNSDALLEAAISLKKDHYGIFL